MAPIQPTLYGSSGGFISGNLDSAAALSQFSRSIDTAYAALVGKALNVMTRHVQDAARNHPQWAPYASMIVAAYTDDEFVYTVHGTADDVAAINDLEYGAPPDFIPYPILRKTLLDDVPEITKMLEMELV